jgi:predicted alpha/beta hydrolase family esterase
VTNPVRFIFVEDDDLVGFGHSLRSTYVVHVDPAVREYEVRGGNVFLVAPVLADARTCDVPDGRSFGHQKRAGIEIVHGVKPLRFDRS